MLGCWETTELARSRGDSKGSSAEVSQSVWGPCLRTRLRDIGKFLYRGERKYLPQALITVKVGRQASAGR